VKKYWADDYVKLALFCLLSVITGAIDRGSSHPLFYTVIVSVTALTTAGTLFLRRLEIRDGL